ncbi:MAG: DoxX family protein [Leptospira sp.]|nr:DoxX family protein [Leptospira sp.]
MNLIHILISISSISFFVYGMSYFFTQGMKSEFKRFGLEKFGMLTAILEICGSIGLIVGLWIFPLLVFSSAGLATLMFLGVIVRVKVRDSFLVSFPAFFFMILNSYIFYLAIQ